MYILRKIDVVFCFDIKFIYTVHLEKIYRLKNKKKNKM